VSDCDSGSCGRPNGALGEVAAPIKAGSGHRHSRFFRHLNQVAFQVPHFEVVSSLAILLNISNIYAARTQDLSRLLNIGGVQHRGRPISWFATRAEANGCLILFRKPQSHTPLCVIHFGQNLLKPEFFDVPSGCSR
jgi:hypothetical protein